MEGAPQSDSKKDVSAKGTSKKYLKKKQIVVEPPKDYPIQAKIKGK